MLSLPKAVEIFEVGPRDGFQIERNFIPTETKVDIINRLSETGVSLIEATSFVHPKVIPQMRDAQEVMRSIERAQQVKYRALVPNTRGALRALAIGVDELLVVLHCSETYSQKNINMSIEESLQETAKVVEIADSEGIPVVAALALAFGCPYEGEIPAERVLRLMESALELGISGFSLPDSVGMADPVRVHRLVSQIYEEWPSVDVSLHLHDAAGMGLANVLAGLEAGITKFESSICGLGGSPVNPRAKGNLATEDLVHMLEEMGIDTGVDLDKLLKCARYVAQVVGHEVPSHVLKIGTRSQVLSAPRD
jgi:hydroxymethylglutaryl-CoA lyase